MNTTLIRRHHHPPPLLTKELRKRGRLNAWALYRIYTPVANLTVCVLLASIIVLMGLPDLWFWLSLALVACPFIWNLGWIIALSDKNGAGLAKRRRYVELDELRKTRAHRGDEATRLHDLYGAYPRYSILVQRDKTAIVLIAVKHDYRGGLLVRWEAKTTKAMYDASRGEWEANRTAEWKVSQPTLDKVMERLTDAQLVVEELENNAYADALRSHQLDVLALAVQPPPASAFSRARVAIGEDVLDDLPDNEGAAT